jgi:hypothetical protein
VINDVNSASRIDNNLPWYWLCTRVSAPCPLRHTTFNDVRTLALGLFSSLVRTRHSVGTGSNDMMASSIWITDKWAEHPPPLRLCTTRPGVNVEIKLQQKVHKDRTSAFIAQRSITFQIKCGERTSDSSRRRSQNVGGAASDSVMHTKGPRSIKIRHYCTTLHHHSTPRHCLSRRTNSLPPYTFTHAVYAQVGIVIFLRFRSLSNIPQYGSTPPNSCFQGSSNASKLTGSADRSEWRIVGIETHKKYSVPFAFA